MAILNETKVSYHSIHSPSLLSDALGTSTTNARPRSALKSHRIHILMMQTAFQKERILFFSFLSFLGLILISFLRRNGSSSVWTLPRFARNHIVLRTAPQVVSVYNPVRECKVPGL
jgi:hypothetical protein